MTASVWHRPLIAETARDQLAERQARAGVALVRMGKAEEVWPLLKHSADPRLRSFIVNWLNPLGADPHAVAAELGRLDFSPRPAERGEGGRRPGEGSSAPAATMDSILFHPETSQRRALVIALGTYGTERLSPGEREASIAKLLDLYRNDPDSGVHGAAGWALRRWGRQEKLRESDTELMKVKDAGGRRWYINSQRQTYAMIEGPTEIRMGMPADDLERSGGADGSAQANGHPPAVRHRNDRGHSLSVPKVPQSHLDFNPAIQPAGELPHQGVAGPGWSLDRPRLVYRGPLLQLAK